MSTAFSAWKKGVKPDVPIDAEAIVFKSETESFFIGHNRHFDSIYLRCDGGIRISVLSDTEIIIYTD